MNDTIIPRTASRAAAPRPGLIDRTARSAILRTLDSLSEGRLVLADDTGTRTFGRRVGDVDLSATLRVADPRFYRLALFGGSLGAAEAYIQGLWSCNDLPALLRLFVRNLPVMESMEGGAARVLGVASSLVHRLRRNTRSGSRRNIHAHYDLGNEFFALFLDETMTYSSGIFPHPGATLGEASTEKLDRLCRKLELKPADRVLEIGTGWGSFALHAAREYGCRVTTTTISPQQHDLARQRFRDAGLDGRIELLLKDYRDLAGTYDKIASIEMIEAVGHEYLGDYFGTCSRLLAEDGLMAIQAITMPDQRYDRYRRSADFIQRYVFPGSCLPSLGAISAAVGRATDMQVVGLEDITAHYVTTLQEWRRRFLAALDDVRRLGYPDEFVRLWDFYLSYCEAGFAERSIGDVQIVFAKPAYGRDQPGARGAA
jgi:cyclopropane-fatty-acyl-phospholipid synthase